MHSVSNDRCLRWNEFKNIHSDEIFLFDCTFALEWLAERFSGLVNNGMIKKLEVSCFLPKKKCDYLQEDGFLTFIGVVYVLYT